jgi:glyoxylase-like metal-dependent hydrolase (beta-lactamase superfamily II)
VSISRRKVLEWGAYALGGASAVLGTSVSAQTVFAVHSFKVGSADIIVLSDGKMSFPQSFVLPDRNPAEVQTLFAANGSPKPLFDAAVNVVLVRIGQRIVVVDTGGGADFMPGLGEFPEVLEAAGMSSDSVTDVIFTHAHPDHFWGVIDPFTEMTRFPNARHYMMAAERDFWLKSGVETQVPEAQKGIALGTHRRLHAMKDLIEACTPGQELVPGIEIVETAGHTPGHASLHVWSAGEDLLIGGDVLAHPLVSFAKPEWRWGPDMDPDSAIKTRMRILDMLAADRIPLLGYHLPWPGTGRVEKHERGYRLAAY